MFLGNRLNGVFDMCFDVVHRSLAVARQISEVEFWNALDSENLFTHIHENWKNIAVKVANLKNILVSL